MSSAFGWCFPTVTVDPDSPGARLCRTMLDLLLHSSTVSVLPPECATMTPREWKNYFIEGGPWLPAMTPLVLTRNSLASPTGIDLLDVFGHLRYFPSALVDEPAVLDTLDMSQSEYHAGRMAAPNADTNYLMYHVRYFCYPKTIWTLLIEAYNEDVPLDFLDRHAERLSKGDHFLDLQRYLSLTPEFIDKHIDYFTGQDGIANFEYYYGDNCGYRIPAWLLEKHKSKFPWCCFSPDSMPKDDPYGPLDQAFFLRHTDTDIWANVGKYGFPLEFIMENLDQIDIQRKKCGRPHSPWASVLGDSNYSVPDETLKELIVAGHIGSEDLIHAFYDRSTKFPLDERNDDVAVLRRTMPSNEFVLWWLEERNDHTYLLEKILCDYQLPLPVIKRFAIPKPKKDNQRPIHGRGGCSKPKEEDPVVYILQFQLAILDDRDFIRTVTQHPYPARYVKAVSRNPGVTEELVDAFGLKKDLVARYSTQVPLSFVEDQVPNMSIQAIDRTPFSQTPQGWNMIFRKRHEFKTITDEATLFGALEGVLKEGKFVKDELSHDLSEAYDEWKRNVDSGLVERE